MVLHDIKMYATPGQKIAFVGSTGAGKTTITNLINRFYDIQDGKIRYDGININNIKKNDLRRSLGIVLQDTNLFTGTIMDNIRYGRLEASDEECIAAARLANADGFIKRLPDGYNTVLHGGGANLSQGQRQLLAIARAGAGVNNIPLDKCAEEGIVVFNTPGANANAVKEQVIAAMLLASRDLIGGNKWVADNAEDPDIARACGVNTNSAMALSYILGYGFAAAAGIMTGILYNSITPALGEVPSYKMLAIIVLGGLGNPLGTVVAGLIIGFAEVMLSTYTKLPIPKDAIAFVVLIIVLLIKPSGLFGQRNKV